MPRFRELPRFSLTAEACRTNAVVYYYSTVTAVVFAHRGSVPCKCRDHESSCHDLPYQYFYAEDSLGYYKCAIVKIYQVSDIDLHPISTLYDTRDTSYPPHIIIPCPLTLKTRMDYAQPYSYLVHCQSVSGHLALG